MSESNFVADISAPPRGIKYALIREWKIVLVFAAIGIAFAVDYLRSETYAYPVQMQLTSVQSNGDDAATSRLGSLSGLAAIATAALPPNQNALQFRLFVDSLRSRDIADELAKNQDLMKRLFSNQWNEATQSWQEPPKTENEERILVARKFLGLAPAQPWHAPDGSDVLNFLNRDLQVDQDPRKPYMVRVVLSSVDTQFAIGFLSLLSRTIDDHLRQIALLRTKSYVNYLSQQLARVTIAEHRAAIAQALSEQEKFAMVASSGAPFSAEVFEKPWASSLPSSPVPRQILAVGVLLGAFVGVFPALLVNRLRRWSQARKKRRAFRVRGDAEGLRDSVRA